MTTCATNNSRPFICCHLRNQARKAASVLTMLLWGIAQSTFPQTSDAPQKQSFVAYAQKVLVEAREQFHSNPTNSEVAWQFARACFDRAEFAENDTERSKLAVEGINAMRSLIARERDSAPAHYYLAMNLGQLARTRLLGALRLVDEMEDEFKAAQRLDDKFSFAGPDRNLGQLYFQAPGWPASIGSRSKARRHMERAAELAPEYPENYLNLIEAYLKWNDLKEAKLGLKSLELYWPDAHTNLTGQAWAPEWVDWDRRRQKLLEKLLPSDKGD